MAEIKALEAAEAMKNQVYDIDLDELLDLNTFNDYDPDTPYFIRGEFGGRVAMTLAEWIKSPRIAKAFHLIKKGVTKHTMTVSQLSNEFINYPEKGCPAMGLSTIRRIEATVEMMEKAKREGRNEPIIYPAPCPSLQYKKNKKAKLNAAPVSTININTAVRIN